MDLWALLHWCTTGSGMFALFVAALVCWLINRYTWRIKLLRVTWIGGWGSILGLVLALAWRLFQVVGE
jgi:hypothetical protein